MGCRQEVPAKIPDHANQDGQQSELVKQSPVEPAQRTETQQEHAGTLPCCTSDGSTGQLEEPPQLVAPVHTAVMVLLCSSRPCDIPALSLQLQLSLTVAR